MKQGAIALVKSFAYAHGEITGFRLWWNIYLSANVKLNPPTAEGDFTRAKREFHIVKQYFTHSQVIHYSL